MELTINGEKRTIEDAATIHDLLAQFELNERIVVVEHNGEIVPRCTYGASPLADGDVLEIVQMSAGG